MEYRRPNYAVVKVCLLYCSNQNVIRNVVARRIYQLMALVSGLIWNCESSNEFFIDIAMTSCCHI